MGRSFLLMLAIFACAGCGQGGARFTFAVGSRGTLPTWQGDCVAGSARGSGIALEGTSFEARAVGSTTLTCARGELTIEVRAIEHLEIEGPDTVPASFVYYRVRAFDGSDELDLGDAPAVTWQHPDVLERGGTCVDMPAHCNEADSIRVRALSNGPARITVSLANETASRDVTLMR